MEDSRYGMEMEWKKIFEVWNMEKSSSIPVPTQKYTVDSKPEDNQKEC